MGTYWFITKLWSFSIIHLTLSTLPHTHHTNNDSSFNDFTGGDAAALDYAAKFDKYEGNIILTKEEIEKACALVPEQLKKDIQFAHANVKKFAEAQKSEYANIHI